MTPEDKKRLQVGGGIVGGLVILGLIIWAIVAATSGSPASKKKAGPALSTLDVMDDVGPIISSNEWTTVTPTATNTTSYKEFKSPEAAQLLLRLTELELKLGKESGQGTPWWKTQGGTPPPPPAAAIPISPTIVVTNTIVERYFFTNTVNTPPEPTTINNYVGAQAVATAKAAMTNTVTLTNMVNVTNYVTVKTQQAGVWDDPASREITTGTTLRVGGWGGAGGGGGGGGDSRPPRRKQKQGGTFRSNPPPPHGNDDPWGKYHNQPG